MSKTIQIEYFGMPGYGQTVKEAKQDAGRKIEALVQNINSSIFFVEIGKERAVVLPTMCGWGYTFLREAGNIHSSCAGFTTKKEAVEACARHLASNAWGFDVDDDFAFYHAALFPYYGRQNELSDVLRDKVSEAAWQRKVRQGMEAGLDMESAREYADGRRTLPTAA